MANGSHSLVVAAREDAAKVVPRKLAEHLKAWVAISLAWAAGFVNVVTWIVLFHVHISFMTGNTSSFGNDLASGNWKGALEHGWPILPFVAGLFYSAATTRFARRHGIHSSFSVALVTEVVLLLAFLAIGASHFAGGKISTESLWVAIALLSLPAAAMGAQTVTVTNVNGLRVYTTYLTGSLSKFAEAVVEYLFWAADRLRSRHPHRLRRVVGASFRQTSLQRAALTAGLWIGFFIGAFCGAVMLHRIGVLSLLAPIAVLCATVVIDILRPVAAADEREAKDSAH